MDLEARILQYPFCLWLTFCQCYSSDVDSHVYFCIRHLLHINKRKKNLLEIIYSFFCILTAFL